MSISFIYNFCFISILLILLNKYSLSYKIKLNGLSPSFQAAINRYYKKIIVTDSVQCTNYIRNKKAIIVLAIESEVISFIKKNYFFLRLKYYDRLIFFNTEINGKRNYNRVYYELVNVNYLWNSYPYQFNFSKRNRVKKKRSEWGYQHMIRFFFKNIFINKAMCDIKWFMRLDTDSIFNSSHNPFNMINDSLVYVYNNFYPERNYDSKHLTVGLKQFLNDYLKYYNIKPKNVNNWNSMFLSRRTRTYYNNLEIVKMDFFLNINVQKFINIIDLSHNIYYNSWGDAPLRYATISIFASENQIAPFNTSNIWYYWHDPN